MNERVVTNPNFKSEREFHKSLAAKPAGTKDWPNTHTEVEHLGKGKFGASIGIGHKVFFDKADGNKPKKHKLTDERPAKDYILIQSAKCCVEVYPYYAKYFDVQHEEVRVEEERWVVQRLFQAPDTWRDVDAYNPQIAVEEYSEPAGDVVKVTVTYDTDYGVLTVEYFQRDGNALKHNVSFPNTSGPTETFRVLQRWAGIVGNKVKVRDKAYSVTAKQVIAGFDFTFGDDAQPFRIRENQSAAYKGTDVSADLERLKWESRGACDFCGACCKAYNCENYNPDLPDKCEIHLDRVAQQWKSEQETFEEWLDRRDKRCIACFKPVIPQQIEGWDGCAFSFSERAITEEDIIPNSLLRPVAIDLHQNGLKCDFIFGNWVLPQGESLMLDPDTATLDNPTEDGYLYNYSAVSSEACLADESPTRETSPADYLFYGGSGAKGARYGERVYVEWPISTLAWGTLTANPTFKYHGATSNASEAEINPITEEAPSGAADANLYAYIASGTAYVDPFNFVAAANQSQDLGASAKTDLQAAMTASQSWFAIGFQSPGDECLGIGPGNDNIYSEAHAGVTPPPTLYVEYTPGEPPPVGLENKSASMGSKMVAAGLI